MNLSAPLGFIVGLMMIAFAISSGLQSMSVFLDPHAAVIVLGGTLAAAMICLPLRQLFNMFRLFLRTISGRQKQEVLFTINEVVELAKAHYNGQKIEDLVGTIKNPFLKESLELATSGGLQLAKLEEVLEMRVQQQNEMYRKEAATYKIIGKFPPAFGLIGATLGMINLLQGLGSPDAFQKLGPSMSVALVSTFYGLVLANVFIIPVGEHLMDASEADLAVRKIVAHGVLLIREKAHPILVGEYLKSYISPKDRNKMQQAA